MIDRLSTSDAPAPGGHYAQGTRFGDLIFVSGQLPITADGTAVTGELEAQTRQVLANVHAVLAAGGAGWGEVLKVTVFLAGVEHWPAFNRVYAEVLGETRPARSVVPVPALHHGFLVEVEAVAVRKAGA